MKFGCRPNPHLYEINVRVFVERLSREYGRSFTLSNVPDEAWSALAHRGFNLVWLMGVWKRSPGALRLARRDPTLRQVYDEVLPGWTESDIGASPYAVFDYTLDAALGKPDHLAQVRESLNRQGLGLILDFVTNHLALDHPWTFSHPGRFVEGTDAAVRAHPDWFFSHDGKSFLAHGRDPNFPAWRDTAQVNFFSPDLRQAVLQEMLRIAGMADGVRCDMAMLGLNGVFGGVWEGYLGGSAAPAGEFWSELIGAVRHRFPGFVFIAEVYWGREAELLRLGFDFVYDKSFYDKLRFGTIGEIREHVLTSPFEPSRAVRFIENHDEARELAAFGRERLPAAAVILATLPGLRLFHDGQLEGRRIRLPVQLLRGPDELTDPEIPRMYDRLLQICSAPAYHNGEWTHGQVDRASVGDASHLGLLAWWWRYRDELKLVVVNYTAGPARGRVRLTPFVKVSAQYGVQDEFTGEMDRHATFGVSKDGLLIRLEPWSFRLFRIHRIGGLSLRSATH
jgi:hypothetical protein